MSYYLFIIAKLFKVKDGCLKFVYIGKHRRFTAFLDSKIHTRLAIVTANELGLAFPPRNLPKKFRPDPSSFYLVIVITDKQTDRQTYAGDSIIPRESFRGDNKCYPFCSLAVLDLRLLATPWTQWRNNGVGMVGKVQAPRVQGPRVPATRVKLLTDLQILGCELHKNAFGGQAPHRALPQTP